MRLISASAILLLSTAFAHAADCDTWTAGVEEDEGGPVMTARICSGTGNAAHELSFHCGAKGELMVRYIPVAPTNYPPDGNGNFTTELEFSSGQEKFRREARYEDMDGAMATEIEIEPFAATLMAQQEVSITEIGGKVPGATFTLAGAKPALEKLIGTCEK